MAAPVELWEPQPDVSSVLAGCVGVLAPSLWLEAWGMVVTEALLRGLPVLVSNLGEDRLSCWDVYFGPLGVLGAKHR